MFSVSLGDGQTQSMDWGVPAKFSLPLGGSTRMATFFGLGVLVFFTSTVSARVVTLMLTLGGISTNVWDGVAVWMPLRVAVVLVIDWRLPCIGQAELRVG